MIVRLQVMDVESRALGLMTQFEVCEYEQIGLVQMQAPYADPRWIPLDRLVVSPWNPVEARALAMLTEE